MQTSHNPSDWFENTAAERTRTCFGLHTPPGLIRSQFPLRGRYIGEKDYVWGVKAGTDLFFVRTKHVPSAFPIEVFLYPHQANRAYCVIASFKAEDVALACPTDSPVAVRG